MSLTQVTPVVEVQTKCVN